MGDSPHGGLTRRSFLKAAGATAGAVGLAGAVGMTSADGWLAPAVAHAVPDEKIAHTYHQSHCVGHCMLTCKVRDGRLCGIEPNDSAREGCQTVCVRGLSEIQHVYSKKRIQTPLKRVGEKGSGDFVPITWDEAMDIFSKGINDCREKHGSSSVFLSAPSECEYKRELTKVVGATNGDTGIDLGVSNGLSPSGLGGLNSFDDWKNADVLIISGTNIMESNLVHMQHFFDAKENGSYTVCVDPHFCTTAGKCDEWIPIEPGTDDALYLGMISHILENELYDEDFMRRSTSFPFLVSEEDGSLVRDHDDPSGEEDGASNPFKVWDSTIGAAVDYSAAVEPALEGSFVVNGVPCKTVFTLLKERQCSYDAAWASSQTGVSEDDIRHLADLYATSDSATLMSGYGGIDKYSNSDVVGHAMALLASLTGNVGRPGCSIGQTYGIGYSNAKLPSLSITNKINADPLDVPIFELPYTENGVHAFVSIGDQLQQRFADFNRAVDWVKSLDFFVYADINMGSSAKYADLILPISSKFECECSVGGLKAQRGHLVLREQVIEPLFESKTDYELMRTLAQALGTDEGIPESAEDFVRWQLENPADPQLEGLTIEELKAHNGVIPVQGTDKTVIASKNLEFKTDSGRIDVYYEDMRPFGQELPAYIGPREASKDNPLRSEYPLQFATLRTRFRIHNQYVDAEWIRQFLDAIVEMNPSDMSKRELEKGDSVKVFNNRGEFVCKVNPNDSVRPGTVRMYEGEWDSFMESGNFQNVTNPTIEERGRSLSLGPVIPYNDTLVEVKKA